MHTNLIWRIAELLGDEYKRSEYGRVILPFIMRRLDQALEPTKHAVLDKIADLEPRGN
jgi:type I restriction enzyme M protein